MRTAIVVAGLAAAVAADYTATSTVDVTVTSCAPSKTDCPANAGAAGWETWSSSSSVDPTSTWGEWSSSSTADPSSTWAEWSSSSSVDPSSTWAEWSSKSTDPSSTWAEWSSASATTTGSSTWGEWSSAAATSTAEACPSYTASGPPEWFSMLPSSVLSSVAAKWTGAPPKDWCYYSYSAVETSTVAVVPTPAASSTWAAWSAAGTGAASSTGAWAAWSGTSTGPAIAKWTGAANANAGSMALAGLAGLAAIIVA